MDKFTYIRMFGDTSTSDVQTGYDRLLDDVERTNCDVPTHENCGLFTCCVNPRFRGHEVTCPNVGTPPWDVRIERMHRNIGATCKCDVMPEYMRARGQICVDCREFHADMERGESYMSDEEYEDMWGEPYEDVAVGINRVPMNN